MVSNRLLNPGDVTDASIAKNFSTVSISDSRESAALELPFFFFFAILSKFCLLGVLRQNFERVAQRQP